MGRLRPRSAGGWIHAKPERLCFIVIGLLVTHPKSYRDDGSPRFQRQYRQSEGEDRCYREKIPEFCNTWAEPDPKQHFSCC